jgi:hypothetical protein
MGYQAATPFARRLPQNRVHEGLTCSMRTRAISDVSERGLRPSTRAWLAGWDGAPLTARLILRRRSLPRFLARANRSSGLPWWPELAGTTERRPNSCVRSWRFANTMRSRVEGCGSSTNSIPLAFTLKESPRKDCVQGNLHRP